MLTERVCLCVWGWGRGEGCQIKSTSDMGSAHSSHSPTPSCYSQLIADLVFALMEAALAPRHLQWDCRESDEGGCWTGFWQTKVDFYSTYRPWFWGKRKLKFHWKELPHWCFFINRVCHSLWGNGWDCGIWDNSAGFQIFDVYSMTQQTGSQAWPFPFHCHCLRCLSCAIYPYRVGPLLRLLLAC